MWHLSKGEESDGLLKRTHSANGATEKYSIFRISEVIFVKYIHSTHAVITAEAPLYSRSNLLRNRESSILYVYILSNV